MSLHLRRALLALPFSVLLALLGESAAFAGTFDSSGVYHSSENAVATDDFESYPSDNQGDAGAAGSGAAGAPEGGAGGDAGAAGDAGGGEAGAGGEAGGTDGGGGEAGAGGGPVEPSYPYQLVEDPSALTGTKVFTIGPWQSAGVGFSVPAGDGSYTARVWVKGEAVATVEVRYKDGTAPALSQLFPTGRVTSDGWAELESAPFSVEDAHQPDPGVGFFSPTGVTADAFEVVPAGEFRSARSCTGVNDASSCLPDEICMFRSCVDARGFVPPIPATKEERVALADYMGNRIKFLFGPLRNRELHLDSATAALDVMRTTEDRYQFWFSLITAIQRLEDSHSIVFGLFQFQLQGFPGRVPLTACFVNGDADQSHDQVPRDPELPDVLVSHTGQGASWGLKPSSLPKIIDPPTPGHLGGTGCPPLPSALGCGLMIHPDAASLALAEFGQVDLGHKARTKRAVQIAEALLSNPGAPLSVACADWSQAKLGYRFLRSRHVGHDDLLMGHIQATAKRCASHPVILAIQDTCEADFSSRKTTEGLSRIGNEGGRGLIFHTGMAVSGDARHEVLGVLHQRIWTRPEETRRSKKLSSAQRKKEPDLESLKWIETAQGVHKALEETKCRLIHVGDRESDIFELFEATVALGDSCVWRVKTDRCLSNEEVKAARAKGQPGAFPKLKTALVFAPALATKTVQVPARKGQPARVASVEIRAAKLPIEPPQNRFPRGEPLLLNLVWVYETDAPAGVEPVCWYLITLEPIDTLAQVEFVVRCYEARWLIEEFHMGVKTGCGLQKRQLETAHALHNALVFASVCAWHLLALRDAARQPSPPPASDVLTPTQLEVLLALRPKLKRGADAYQALRAIATLGGFLARKGDGEPGWRTLWTGFRYLLIAERGYLAARGITPSMLHETALEGVNYFG